VNDAAPAASAGAGAGPLVVPVAELLRRPASRTAVQRQVRAERLRVVDAEVPDGTGVDVDVELESLTDGIVVTGRVAAPWTATCRRCLGPVSGRIDVEVREVYRPAPEIEDAFALDGDRLDLEPLVREALMLELPLAPLCRPDCAGLCPECGANRNEGDCGHRVEAIDHRWAALSDLAERLDRPER
jgi:uncharacterized protein